MGFAPGKRRRINIVGIALNIFFPFFMFASLYCSMSFKFHYKNPLLCWLMVFAYLVVAGFVCLYAQRARKRDREPRWLWFTAGAVMSTMSVHRAPAPHPGVQGLR